MELNKAPSPSQYTPTILIEAAKSTLDDEENNISAAGANAGTGAATYTKEAELMMDEQLQEQRDEQHRDDQNAQLNNWQLQNASFKA